MVSLLLISLPVEYRAMEVLFSNSNHAAGVCRACGTTVGGHRDSRRHRPDMFWIRFRSQFTTHPEPPAISRSRFGTQPAPAANRIRRSVRPSIRACGKSQYEFEQPAAVSNLNYTLAASSTYFIVTRGISLTDVPDGFGGCSSGDLCRKVAATVTSARYAGNSAFWAGPFISRSYYMSVSTVPEPSTFVMAGLGVLTLAWGGRRRFGIAAN